MDVHATKNVSIGIDPYPYNIVHTNLQDAKHLGHAGVVPVAPLQPTATGWSNASLWCREKCHGMMSDVSVIALIQGKKYGKILVLSGEYMCSYVFFQVSDVFFSGNQMPQLVTVTATTDSESDLLGCWDMLLQLPRKQPRVSRIILVPQVHQPQVSHLRHMVKTRLCMNMYMCIYNIMI